MPCKAWTSLQPSRYSSQPEENCDIAEVSLMYEEPPTGTYQVLYMNKVANAARASLRICWDPDRQDRFDRLVHGYLVWSFQDRGQGLAAKKGPKGQISGPNRG